MSFIKSKFLTLVLFSSMVMILSSCTKSENPIPNEPDTITNESLETPVNSVEETPGSEVETSSNQGETLGNEPAETPVNEQEKPVDNILPSPPPIIEKPSNAEKLIVIDAGHQSKGNSNKEKNSPSSSVMKAKVSSGTKGVSTGLYEYELNLIVTFKLQAELERRGYRVILVRDKHEVDISNVERAMVANEAGADAFIRIHANGADDQGVHGALTICQTSKNLDNSGTYKQSYALSEKVLKNMVKATGAKDRGIWQTDTMTGINWSKVPSTIVEMGFMSNPREDELLSADAYQDKIVQGISDGVDEYFTN